VADHRPVALRSPHLARTRCAPLPAGWHGCPPRPGGRAGRGMGWIGWHRGRGGCAELSFQNACTSARLGGGDRRHLGNAAADPSRAGRNASRTGDTALCKRQERHQRHNGTRKHRGTPPCKRHPRHWRHQRHHGAPDGRGEAVRAQRDANPIGAYGQHLAQSTSRVGLPRPPPRRDAPWGAGRCIPGKACGRRVSAGDSRSPRPSYSRRCAIARWIPTGR
jgi:hypothetical protein